MENTILLKNANIIDGYENSEVLQGFDVLIKGNKIVKVGKYISRDKKGLIIDCKGKYIIPGLINLHVHLPANGKAPFKNSNTKKLAKLIVDVPFLHPIGVAMGKKYCIDDLKSGVTTVRAVGGVSDFDTQLRDKINSGKVVGPRLFVSNSAIGDPNGHRDGTVAVPCNSVEECVEMVQKLHKQNCRCEHKELIRNLPQFLGEFHLL